MSFAFRPCGHTGPAWKFNDNNGMVVMPKWRGMAAEEHAMCHTHAVQGKACSGHGHGQVGDGHGWSSAARESNGLHTPGCPPPPASTCKASLERTTGLAHCHTPATHTSTIFDAHRHSHM